MRAPQWRGYDRDSWLSFQRENTPSVDQTQRYWPFCGGNGDVPLTELDIKTSCYDFCSPRKQRNTAFNMRSAVHSFSVPLKKHYSVDLLALFHWVGPKAGGGGGVWGGEDRGGGGRGSALNRLLPVSKVLPLQQQIYQSFHLTILWNISLSSRVVW